MVRTALAIVVLALASCGSSESCPNDLPSSCLGPTTPSYSADIAPIVSAHCLKCHAPGGQSADIPLGTSDDLLLRRSEVLNQVYACRMPPPGEPGLTTSERHLLLQWLVCSGPQN